MPAKLGAIDAEWYFLNKCFYSLPMTKLDYYYNEDVEKCFEKRHQSVLFCSARGAISHSIWSSDTFYDEKC